MFKRITLFLLTNIAVILIISVVLNIFNVRPYLNSYGINVTALLIFAAIFGFAGSFVSLLLSKWMAKRAYRIHLIEQPRGQMESWLYDRVTYLASQAGIGMPEVGIYDSHEPNAFATGWNRNNALIAISTGLLDFMDEDEVEAVLGHEIAHVANGDMVTLTLLQGVVNTFVIFFARLAAGIIAGNRERPRGTMAYYGTAMLFEMVFGLLATMIVMAFSRHREYRADAGSARALGRDKMIRALQRLQAAHGRAVDPRAPELAAFKISGTRRVLMRLFSSHPPLASRIEALRRRNL